MKQILTILIFALAFSSCNCHIHDKRHVYKTTDKPGYCYHDNTGLWYIYYMNPNGSYYYYGTINGFTSYDNSSVSWTPNADNVSNFSEAEAAGGMSESTGESAGGSDGNGSDGGMSEGSGESSGGSDSGGGDSGGGGDGGGGGD